MGQRSTGRKGESFNHSVSCVIKVCAYVAKDHAIAKVHAIARILEWVTMHSSRGFSQPRIEPRSPALLGDSLPSKPPWKPKNTGVGSLTLLRGVFPSQELNQGLLH